jgi:NAD-dependent dihydropyrimidine dehydrogenase PreA subunit
LFDSAAFHIDLLLPAMFAESPHDSAGLPSAASKMVSRLRRHAARVNGGRTMPPVIDRKLCNLCGICYKLCPQDVFGPIKGQEPPTIDYPRECWYWAVCVMDCPVEAVSLEWLPQMHMVPSPALYGPPKPGEEDMVKAAAAVSRSVVKD